MYSGTVTWGDGTTAAVTFVRASTSSSGSIWQVRASHNYTKKGTFEPVIKLHDVASAAQVLTINDTIRGVVRPIGKIKKASPPGSTRRARNFPGKT